MPIVSYSAVLEASLQAPQSQRWHIFGAMPDGILPVPGGWNRIELIVENLPSEVDDRLKAEGLHFRNDIVTGPGGSQILLIDPSGNFVELFEPR